MTHDGGIVLSTAEASSTTEATGQSGNDTIRAPIESRVKSGARSGLSGFARVRHEHYVEEPWVSARLFAARRGELHVPGLVVLDPAAGFGHIVGSARAAGHEAIGTDLIKRAPSVRGGRDFLSAHYRRPRRGRPLAIACNPPFGLFREFTEKALRLADVWVAVLIHTRRLNAAGVWLTRLPLQRILYVTPRPSMWPGAIYRQRLADGLSLGTGWEDFCWLIFKVGGRYRGEAGWLEREGRG
jgi:hypothetical protein